MIKKKIIFLGLLVTLITNLLTPVLALTETKDSTTIVQQSQTVSKDSVEDTNLSETNRKEKILNSRKIPSPEKDNQYLQTSSSSKTVKLLIPNVFKNIKLTRDSGEDVNGKTVNQWELLTLSADFELPNNKVNDGDTSVLSIPNELSVESMPDFDVLSPEGDKLATAHVDTTAKTITLTYTDYVETHSNIRGSIRVFTRIDTSVTQDSKVIPIKFEDGTTIIIDYDREVDDPTPFTKGGRIDLNDPQTIIYVVKINVPMEDLKNVVVADNMETSNGITYDPSGFQIIKGEYFINDVGAYDIQGEDVTSQYLSRITMTSQSSFTFNLGDTEGKGFMLVYTAKLSYTPISGEIFKNHIKITSDKLEPFEITKETKYSAGGGSGEGYQYGINIIKKDEDGNLLSGAEFKIMRDSTGESVGTIITDNNGEGSLRGLLQDDYTIKEIKAPDGYELSPAEIRISSEEFDVTQEILKEITNRKKDEPKTNIGGIKKWNDSDNQEGKRPEKIIINLLADGKQTASKEVTAADDWKYEFTDLPKFKDGEEIIYTITENSVEDYTTEINETDIINSFTPGKTSVSVTKNWNDSNNRDGKRPNSIQVQLLADGEKHGVPVKLNIANNWTTTWSDLNQKANGKDIIYTVEEVTVPGYTITIDDSDKGNILITNTYTPETTTIGGTKTWNDSNNQEGKRPDKITVNLLANGKQTASKEVSAADDWEYKFTKLPKFENGKEIVYTITENSVEDYTTEINGTNLINSYNPGKISGTVTKRWEDNNDRDGIRPDSIKLQLYANGKEQGQTVELNEKSKWTYTWRELAAKDKEGKTIQYSVKEVDIADGYTATITGKNTGNIVITNTHSSKEADKSSKTTNSESLSSSSNIFPKTGESKVILLTIIGLVLVLVAIICYSYQRKNKEK